LESPVEDKPTCFFVAGPPESHDGVVAESVECLANQVEAYSGFIRYLIICNLVNLFEGFNYSNNVLSEQRNDLVVFDYVCNDG
jgi:hypothetical protein